MRRNKTILLIGVSIISLSMLFGACTKEAQRNDSTWENGILIKDDDSEEYGDMYDISLTLNDENTLIYEIKTYNDHIIGTGRPYTIEKINDKGEWEMIDLDLMFTMELIVVDESNPFSQEIDISELEIGEYRVDKHLMDEEGDSIENLGAIKFEILD